MFIQQTVSHCRRAASGDIDSLILLACPCMRDEWAPAAKKPSGTELQTPSSGSNSEYINYLLLHNKLPPNFVR